MYKYTENVAGFLTSLYFSSKSWKLQYPAGFLFWCVFFESDCQLYISIYKLSPSKMGVHTLFFRSDCSAWLKKHKDAVCHYPNGDSSVMWRVSWGFLSQVPFYLGWNFFCITSYNPFRKFCLSLMFTELQNLWNPKFVIIKKYLYCLACIP